MEDVSKKLAELEEAAKMLPQKGVSGPTSDEIDAELKRDIKDIESKLDKRILPQIVDEKAFFIEQMPNFTVEWFLFKDDENRIRVLYKETPTHAGTEYKAKKEERSVFDWDLEITRLIIDRLPSFIEVITRESKKYQRE